MKERYIKNVVPELKKEFKIKNDLAVPRFTKIVVNIGIGSMLTKQNKKDYDSVKDNIMAITGQNPSVKKAKKAISNFKLRQGMPVGLVCTLRGKRMYDFLSKVINIALPRIRDFQGLSTRGIDKGGNFSVGIKEHTIFPEINVENVASIHGLQINFVTTAKSKYQAYVLLKKLGMPFRDEVANTNA